MPIINRLFGKLGLSSKSQLDGCKTSNSPLTWRWDLVYIKKTRAERGMFTLPTFSVVVTSQRTGILEVPWCSPIHGCSDWYLRLCIVHLVLILGFSNNAQWSMRTHTKVWYLPLKYKAGSLFSIVSAFPLKQDLHLQNCKSHEVLRSCVNLLCTHFTDKNKPLSNIYLY